MLKLTAGDDKSLFTYFSLCMKNLKRFFGGFILVFVNIFGSTTNLYEPDDRVDVDYT